jgi:hypothetical protein
MLANPLVARWDVIAATQHAVRYGGASLRNVPGLLKRVIREETWKEYVVPSGEVMQFEAFTAFVESQWGLDTTLAMIQNICKEDLEAIDWIDKATRRKPGPKKSVPQDKTPDESQGSLLLEESVIDDYRHNMTVIPNSEKLRGTSRAYALRRLRKHKPTIHARVLAGELSPRQGMIEAGFLHPPTPLDMLHRYWRQVSPEDRLRFLTEMLTPNERRALQFGFEEEELRSPSGHCPGRADP